MQIIESANEIKEQASGWFESITEYIEARLNLSILDFSNKSAHTFSNLASVFILGAVSAVVMLFLSISLALFIGQKINSLPLGFLFMGLVYTLLGGVLFLNQDKLIKTPILNIFIKFFLS